MRDGLTRGGSSGYRFDHFRRGRIDRRPGRLREEHGDQEHAAPDRRQQEPPHELAEPTLGELVDDLVGDNHVLVPEDPAQLEVSWSLLQADPPNGGNKRQRGKLGNQGNLGNGHHAVVRRYEHYEYSGVYDPITHEALCADLLRAFKDDLPLSNHQTGESYTRRSPAAKTLTLVCSVTAAWL